MKETERPPTGDDRRPQEGQALSPGRGIRGGRTLLLLLVLLALALPAKAEEKFCSDAPYNGVIDGELYPVPTQITIDRDCTFQNFPAEKPLTTTVNFQTNDPSIYLIVFDNVHFTGHMACANVDHRIWFANGSDYGSSNSCQDLFIPVESIDKQAPAATAAVGVPFTYTLVLPSYAEVGGPSVNDLHTVTLWDDLSATGVDLTYVDLNAYYQGSGDPVTLVPEDDPLARGGVWTPKNLSYKPIPLIPNGEQIVVEITVVLDDTGRNTAGISFVNTAKWWFGRLIEGTFYEPLPGEWGVSEPMTIAEPELVVTKSSDETALNLGVPATFTVDVENVGGSAAWNATILDLIPEGMCAQDPTAALAARIVAADGTLRSELTAGSDYALSYAADPGSACPLTLTMESAEAAIGPSEHLLVSYVSQLDPDIDTDGLVFTNVAGATEWFSADPGENPAILPFSRALTDGTPTVVDHQDSQSVTTALAGYYVQKTVTNLTTGASPAATAVPGDRLRYRLRLFNVDQAIEGITISDPVDLDTLDPGTFAMATLPAQSAFSFDAASGLLEVAGDGAPLAVAAGEELVVEFDVTLRPDLPTGTEVVNQAAFSAAAVTVLTDDPYVNGVAPPGEPGDPTVVVIESPGPLAKEVTQPSAAIGEEFSYRLTVPAEPVATPLYDVRVLDDLALAAADLRFVRVSVVSGGTWALSNTGDESNLVIEDAVTGIDIPAGGQAVIEVTVALENSAVNQGGLPFDNRAHYTYNRINGSDATQLSGDAVQAGEMTVAEPTLNASKTVRFVVPAQKSAEDAATAGDVLEYAVTLGNGGDSTAFDVNVVDTLPANLSPVAGSATARIDGVAVDGFVVEPTVLAAGAIAWGRRNGDETLDIPPGRSLVLTYRATVESVAGAQIVNGAYGDWTSLDGADAGERTGAGCPDVTAPDDYCSGPATAVIASLDETSLTKAVVEDSFAEAPASGGDPAVRVGDLVTYELTLNLQEHATADVVVEDELPAGMALESFSIDGAGFDYTLAAQPAVGDTGTLRWAFGDVVNPPSGDRTPVDPLTIRYVARVISDAPPAGIAHQPSTSLANRARLTYAGGDPATEPERLTATATIEVRQPRMSAVGKVDRAGGRAGAGTAEDPFLVDLAADTMNFRLESCNEGEAPAYGVVITDLLAPELDEGDLAATPPVVRVADAALSSGTDFTFSPPERGGEMEIALLDGAPVQPGACVTVDYDIGFHTDLSESRTWSNEAILSSYRSLSDTATARLYSPSETARIWMSNRVSTEQLAAALVTPAEATVGDEVLYRLTVPSAPMNTALDEVVVSDLLPAALEYVGATAVDGDGEALALTDNSVAPGQVSLAIAHIPAGGQAVITLSTRVANVEAAAAGVSFTNTASYAYAGMPDGLDTAATSAAVTIVEPAIDLARTVSNVSRPGVAPGAGDVLRHSLSLSAAGGTAGDVFADAFDVAIEDVLGAGQAYRNGTATVDGGNLVSDPVVAGDGAGAEQTLTWSPVDLTAEIGVSEGTAVTVTYETLVLDGALPGQELTASATVRWTGRDGEDTFERTGSGTPAVNDYVVGPVTTALLTELAIAVEKSVVNVSTGEDPGANARPGDTLRYTLTVANESIAPLTNAALVDELAPQFAAGTLQLVTLPAGADTTATDATGGAAGKGIVDLRDLTLAPQGEVGDALTVVFEATLAPVIPNGTTVRNLAQLSGDQLAPVASNETATLIASAPILELWKSSADLTGSSNELRPGDTLRYTLTVRNVGDENTVAAVLRDQTPANTRYVGGSTTLNGAPVSDPAAGASPLQAGLPIRSADAATPGLLYADASQASGAEATVTFDVVVDGDVVEGAIIANQGFLDAEGEGSGPLAEEPSDDPATPVLDDPTRDIVGSLPLVDAHKTVRIVADGGSPGIVDPADVLRYTIVVSNSGAAAATGVVLTDAVPADTAYVADSVRLNGLPVGMPDGGVSPLTAGIDLSSADLTPPLPGAGTGTLSADAAAEVTFDVRVLAGVAAGTVISNQGFVAGREFAEEPTDVDGIDGNGDQPTEVVVGEAQQLSILKEVAVVGGGAAEAGGELEYRIRVRNIGSLPATDVVVSDDLGPLAGVVSYVADSATLDGSAAGVSFSSGVLTADYGATRGELPPGDELVVRFRVRIEPALPIGTRIANTAAVRWNDPAVTETASVSLDLGGTPGSVSLSGRVWHDADLDKLFDDGERRLEGWTVELHRDGLMLADTATDAEGAYRFAALAPNTDSGAPYELRFIARGAGVDTASLGRADSPFADGPQQIGAIVAAGGANLSTLNLPISPNGVVYDSVLRTPVAGARLALVNPETGLTVASRCFDDPLQREQVTALDGYYKFDLNFSDPSCPPDAAYLIDVTSPASGYEAAPSRIIPSANGADAPPFSVPDCPGGLGDAVPASGDSCQVTASATIPPITAAPGAPETLYRLHLTLSDGYVPGQSQIFNNPIPVDPVLDGAVAVSKRSPRINVSKGELVPYTITVQNVFGAPLYNTAVVDRFPAGFKYVEGSARLDGEEAEPQIEGRELLWSDLDLPFDVSRSLQLLLVVGGGVSEGEYVNRAQAYSTVTGGTLSGEGTATVRVVPDPTFDCTDVIGKVFDDRNRNGYPDAGEPGLGGARVVTARGLIATTDEHGRFHITCAAVPDQDRGSNFILKLDERSLPTGYRVTSENPRVQRATRGKMLKFNFGAAIHRVVSIDLADGVFTPETTELRLQWRPNLDRLLQVLAEAPAVLRLCYLADVEDEDLVAERLATLKKEVAARWRKAGGDYRLTVETEVFWRRGGPVGD